VDLTAGVVVEKRRYRDPKQMMVSRSDP